MEFRKIGKLSVSVVGIGCNQFGTHCDEANTKAVVDAAIAQDINFFDVADEYGLGKAEEVLGRALRGRREKVVIATKVGCAMDDDPTHSGASARWIAEAVEASLRRLGTDYIDLYQIHFPDPKTPIAETLDALGRLIEAGKVREIGCCNFTGPMIEEAMATSAQESLPRFVSAQMHLNLIRQHALKDTRPACQAHNLAILPYFPLASGLLTGKYKLGAPPPAGSRFEAYADAAEKMLSERNLKRVDAITAYAQARGHSTLEAAFGWLLADPLVASVIAGATKAAQVDANIAASGWRPSPGERAGLQTAGAS